MEEVAKKSPLFLWLAIISFLAALVTFMPFKNIDDECMLGYKAICAFTPVSSIILILLGIIFLVMRKYSGKKI